MRRALIERDLVECVLGLGPNLFYNSPMEACVVVCRTRKPPKRRGKVLFIDAVRQIARERAQSFLTPEHQKRILAAYDAFRVFATLLANSITKSVDLGTLLTEAPRNGCSAVETSTPTGHWVLGLDALTKSGYRPGRLKPVRRTAAMLSSVVEAGDLLISRSNTRDRVGLPAIFNEARCDVSWPDTMMRLRADPSVARPRFLELFLRSESGRRQIERFAAGTSASMKKINARAVRQLSIALPSSHTQDAILRQVGDVMAACASAERRLRTLKQLRSNVPLVRPIAARW